MAAVVVAKRREVKGPGFGGQGTHVLRTYLGSITYCTIFRAS